MARIVLSAALLLLVVAFRADKPAYQLFKEKGKKSSYEKLLKAAKEADFVFFGELHNNPISHWLQYELTKDLVEEKKDKLKLGAEMFEADGQLILNEYLRDIISQKKFESEMRLWENYQTDYKPLVELAKKNNLKFVATNIPRRYASLVFHKGFAGIAELSDQAKQYIAPQPIAYDAELPGYKQMTQMGQMGGHMAENLPKAQAVKDATMAHFILSNWKEGETFVHYNGTYHSNNFEGIVWYIKQKNPSAKILTIATVEQDSVRKLEEKNEGLANFILAVPSSMTKTHR